MRPARAVNHGYRISYVVELKAKVFVTICDIRTTICDS